MGGTISLNMGPISLGMDMGPGGGPYISNDMGLPGPMSLGKWGRGGGGTISLNMGPMSLGIWGRGGGGGGGDISLYYMI